MDQTNLAAALGPLAALYADPDIKDILVDAPDRVYVVRSGTAEALEEAGVTFHSPEAVEEVARALLAFSGVELSPAHSLGEARLPDGARVLAVAPPTALNSPYLVIRKMDREKPKFTWERLLGYGTLTAEAQAVLMNGLRYWVNMLIVGDTRNAKNYLLDLLAESIPPEERVIVIADSYALPVARHPRRIHLEPGGPGGLQAGPLLDAAARMRPDWLVVGDLQGVEALKLIQLMNSGYHGLATLCANSPEEALAQIETLCLMANPGLGLPEIRQSIASAIGLISFQLARALPDYRIKITQLVEVRGVENDRYLLQPLFTYDNEQGVLQPTGAAQGWADRMQGRLTHG